MTKTTVPEDIENNENIDESIDNSVNPEYLKKSNNLNDANDNNKPKDKKIGLTIAIIGVILIMLSLTAITFNVINIRLSELTQVLGLISKAQEGNKSLHMLVRYFQVTQRLSSVGEEDEENNNLAEVAMATVLPNVDYEKELNKKVEDPSLLDAVTHKIIVGIRFLIGKNERATGESILDNPLIQQAYVSERGRLWDKSLQLYMNFIKENMESLSLEEKAFLELHIAYCNAQKSEFKSAIAYLDGIEKADLKPDNMTTGKNDTQEVAIKLKNILEGLLIEQEKINKETDLLVKGESYFNIADYINSISTLETFKSTINKFEFYNSTPQIRKEALEQADYYIARSLEELGKLDKAAKIYDKLIKNESTFANRAMQRVIINKEVYKTQNQTLTTTFKKIQKDKKNDDFLKQVTQLTRTEQDVKKGAKGQSIPSSSSMRTARSPSTLINKFSTKVISNVNSFTNTTKSAAAVTSNINTQKAKSEVKIQQAAQTGKSTGGATALKKTAEVKMAPPTPKVAPPTPKPTTAVKPPTPKVEKPKPPRAAPAIKEPKVQTPNVSVPTQQPQITMKDLNKVTRLETKTETIAKEEKIDVIEVKLDMEKPKKTSLSEPIIDGTFIGLEKSEGPVMKGIQTFDDPDIKLLIPKRKANEVTRSIPVDKIKEAKGE